MLSFRRRIVWAGLLLMVIDRNFENCYKLTKNYKGIWGPRNGYYLYQDYNGLRGYLNQDGSIAIPAQYKNARQFGAEYAPVCTEDGWHIINPLGEIVY